MEKKIKLKNYVYLFLILFVSIIIMFLFYNWYKSYKENLLKNPIMNEYIYSINYNELDNYVMDNGNALVYVSVLEDESIRNFEDKFKKFVVRNELGNKMLYLDLTEVSKDNILFSELINKYRINKKSIDNLPCLLLFKDGKLDSIYNINEKKYNLNEIKFFLEQEGILDD